MHYNYYILFYSFHLSKSSREDRSLSFDDLVESALSIQAKAIIRDSPRSEELPKAPKLATEPNPSELWAKADHALRRLRMCLRDVYN